MRGSFDSGGGDLQPRLRFRWRFNPQVLVLVIGGVIAWPAIVGVVVSGVHVLWGATFRQVDYTMHEARFNEGYPYISGTLAVTNEPFLVPARRAGHTFLVGERGDDPFESGRVVKVWWSPSAPDLAIAGRRTNGIPVSSLPERPGLASLAGHLAWLVAVAWATLRIVRWILLRQGTLAPSR